MSNADKKATKRKAKTKKSKPKKTAEELEALAFTKRTGRIFQNQRRDAREAGVWLDYDVAGFRKLVQKALDNESCPYCDGRLTVINFSCDHKVPKTRGGHHSIVNLIICCKNCNQAKGALDHIEWRQLMNVMSCWSSPVRQHTIARLRAGGARIRSGPSMPRSVTHPVEPGPKKGAIVPVEADTGVETPW